MRELHDALQDRHLQPLGDGQGLLRWDIGVGGGLSGRTPRAMPRLRRGAGCNRLTLVLRITLLLLLLLAALRLDLAPDLLGAVAFEPQGHLCLARVEVDARSMRLEGGTDGLGHAGHLGDEPLCTGGLHHKDAVILIGELEGRGPRVGGMVAEGAVMRVTWGGTTRGPRP